MCISRVRADETFIFGAPAAALSAGCSRNDDGFREGDTKVGFRDEDRRCFSTLTAITMRLDLERQNCFPNGPNQIQMVAAYAAVKKVHRRMLIGDVGSAGFVPRTREHVCDAPPSGPISNCTVVIPS